MRRFMVWGLALVIGMAIGVAPATAQQNLKVGFINSQRILSEAPGAGDAQRQFEADMTRYRSQIDSLEASLERAQQNYQRQQATLDEAARRARQQELQQQFAQYQQRVLELEQTAQRRQAELVEPIMRRISGVIDQLRQSGGYSMIFDASAGALIAADPSLDLTDQVLAALRAQSE